MNISANLQQVQKMITAAALRSGRDPAAIRLIAVTKYSGIEQINEAIQAGITEIGENRIQDAQYKFPALAAPVTRHLIGSLQRNKVKVALELFDIIHSLDRPELAQEIAKHAVASGRRIPVLIQVNIAAEESKHGIAPDGAAALLEEVLRLPGLLPCGLMTIAPLAADGEAARPVFRELRLLFKQLAVTFKLEKEWRFLSMGMSLDFTVAVEEGANMLRVGSALFTTK
jgi:pyridoxal phosphate enzyme (YggS family)